MPRIANAFEANTRYGSFDTARIAGTESTAKITSVISTTNSAPSNGVAIFLPLTRVKNFWPSSSSLIGTNRLSSPSPRVDSSSPSSSRCLMTLAPV